MLKLRLGKKNIGENKKEPEEWMDKENVKRMKEKSKKEKEKKKKERDLKKLFRREVRQSEERILTEVRDLRGYCQERFDSIVVMIKTMSQGQVPETVAPTPCSPKVTLSPATKKIPKETICVSKSTPDSKACK